MEDIANRAAEIELYKDLIKIGLPALTGIVAGFLGGILPYLLEKRKLQETIKKENRDFRRQQCIELIDCVSDFSGNLFKYINLARSEKYYRGQSDYEIQMRDSVADFLRSEGKLKKARAIAGMLGITNLLEKLEQFDLQVTKTVNSFLQASLEIEKEQLDNLKQLEKEVVLSFNSLLDEK